MESRMFRRHYFEPNKESAKCSRGQRQMLCWRREIETDLATVSVIFPTCWHHFLWKKTFSIFISSKTHLAMSPPFCGSDHVLLVASSGIWREKNYQTMANKCFYNECWIACLVAVKPLLQGRLFEHTISIRISVFMVVCQMVNKTVVYCVYL